jgi:hypothetical protein
MYKGRNLSKWAALVDKTPPSHQAMHALGEMGEPAIPVLVKAMRSHRDGAIRWLSHVALAKVGRGALPELDKIMGDGDRGARMQAVLAFEKILSKEAIPRLLKAAQDRDAGVCVRAHGALLRLGEPKEQHLPTMLEILRDKSRNAQWLAAEAIGSCGTKAAGAEDSLAAALKGPSQSVSERALKALEQLGTAEALRLTYDQLPKLHADPHALRGAQLQIIFGLGSTGQALTALPLFRSIVADPDEDVVVRGYAAWAVEQTEPRPPEEQGDTYHVAQEHPRAGDQNSGTADQPWKTIRRAAEALRPGDTVLIHSGVYREFVRPFLGGAGYDRMITYRAAPGEKPVLKGSAPWQPEWQDEGKGLWSAPYQRHSWDFPEKWAKPRSGPMHRAEQVFVDGKLLTHVEKLAELKGKAGSFYTDDEASRLWLHLEDTAPPARRLIERSMRQQVFAPAVRGLGYIRLQGLTMLHAAAPESNGANWRVIAHRAMLSIRSGHHWIVEDNTIEWGNAQGFDVGGEGWSALVNSQPIVSEEKGWHQVRRNRVNYHGVAGIVGWAHRVNHVLLEDNETNFNAQKGNFYQYETGGVKLHNVEDSIIRRHRAHGNNTFGIWLDYLCLRNRVTQCILTENMGAGFFFEVSAGPLLVDNNVILNTRDAPRGNWGEGIYSHDGNRAVYINNYIHGCRGYGVRLRNLFARQAGGKPTTTSHNRVWNNFIFANQRGVYSFNPEVPRAEDNHSDHNLIWNVDGDLVVGIENASSGVDWEGTRVGKALGWSGRGNKTISFSSWRKAAEEDAHTLAVPGEVLFAGLTPEQIRERLVGLWSAGAPALDAGYGEVQPRERAELVGELCPDLAGAECVRTIALSPKQSVQIWRTSKGVQTLVAGEEPEDVKLVPLQYPALLGPPHPSPGQSPTLPVGESLRLPIPAGATVILGGLAAEVEDRELVVTAQDDTAPGQYGVVIAWENKWRCQAVEVAAAYMLSSVVPVRDGGTAVLVSVQNNRSVPVPCTVAVKLGSISTKQTATLAPQGPTGVRVPLKKARTGRAEVTVTLAGCTLTDQRLLSFARAVRAADWSAVPTFLMDEFPGGVFPEGAEAFALYQGGLSATWAARYDDRRLYIRTRVRDAKHMQKQPAHRLWKQDSLQLLLKAKADRPPLALDLARNSETGEVSVFRCQWPGVTPVPAAPPKGFVADVTRQGKENVYTVALPWPMLGCDGPPPAEQPVRLSVLVNSDDGKGRIGLQWFFGIHGKRGQEEAMGTLWLDERRTTRD